MPIAIGNAIGIPFLLVGGGLGPGAGGLGPGLMSGDSTTDTLKLYALFLSGALSSYSDEQKVGLLLNISI